MGLYRRTLSLLVASGVLAGSAVARAQAATPSLVLANNLHGVLRGTSYDPSELTLDRFNLQNCLADEQVTFKLSLGATPSAAIGFEIQAWVGAACEQAASRDQGACLEVGRASPTDPTVVVRLEDLVGPRDGSTPVDGPCTSASATPMKSSLYFMLLDSEGHEPSGGGTKWYATWTFSYDFVGPPAPTSIAASAVAGGLLVSWDYPDAPLDLAGYALLCDPPPDAGATGSAGAGDGADSSAPCGSGGLRTGELATADDRARYACAEVEATALSAETTPLSGDAPHAVAVVARDFFYNRSPVSELACATAGPPADTTGHPVGGRVVSTGAGCALSAGRRGSLGAWLTLGLLASLSHRRRHLPRR
jgi:hypothetical protein